MYCIRVFGIVPDADLGYCIGTEDVKADGEG